MSGYTSDLRIHLAICPTRTDDAALLREIAAVTGMTAYDLRLRLKSELPRSVICCDSIEEAEEKAARLNRLGLSTLVYRQEDLPPLAPLRIRRLKRSGQLFRFEGRGDVAQEMPAGEIILMVYGKRTMTTTTTEMDVGRKFSAGYSVMAGYPVSRYSANVTSKLSREDEHFLMAYTLDAAAPAIEFAQGCMDFSCLGSRKARTRIENIQILVSTLQKLLPAVPVDLRLLKGQSDNSESAFYNRRLVSDSSSAYATLIFWQYLAERNGRRHFTARR
ncbi:MAG: hypothetical protein ABII12_15710 [Planctomycetota bacterium]